MDVLVSFLAVDALILKLLFPDWEGGKKAPQGAYRTRA
jgi:hypothetical protein